MPETLGEVTAHEASSKYVYTGADAVFMAAPAAKMQMRVRVRVRVDKRLGIVVM